jgi:ubiquinone/menaquinone biosynthesis C-methylase UbiE
VLDVACGPGFLTLAFAQHAAEAVGVDATGTWLPRAQAEAERRGIGNVSFVEGTAEQLLFDDDCFDITACRAACHHFLRPQDVIGEMKRVTRPGGRILIADLLASEDAAKADYHNRIERLCDRTHTRALSESEFRRIFKDAGLTLVLARKKPLHYEVDQWMEHGGPGKEAARQIVSLFQASLDVDRSGLNVRREFGKLYFSHVGAAFVLEVPMH